MTVHASTGDLQFDLAGEMLTVYVTGELDAELAPAVADQISSNLHPSCRELWLDLSEVTFCDSSGMRLLFSLHRQMTAAGGRCILYDPAPPVRKVLAMVDPQAKLKIRTGARWPDQ
jgi:anti-sigma B factor antagonist